jgi:hypothetical protein
MRFSSLVSLIVVSASLALGGCAADAEEAPAEATAQARSAAIGHLDLDDQNAEKAIMDGRAAVNVKTVAAERDLAPGMGVDNEPIDRRLNPNALGGVGRRERGELDRLAPGNEPLQANAYATNALGSDHADGCAKREP